MYNAYKEEKHALPTNEKAKRNDRSRLRASFWAEKKSMKNIFT